MRVLSYGSQISIVSAPTAKETFTIPVNTLFSTKCDFSWTMFKPRYHNQVFFIKAYKTKENFEKNPHLHLLNIYNIKTTKAKSDLAKNAIPAVFQICVKQMLAYVFKIFTRTNKFMQIFLTCIYITDKQTYTRFLTLIQNWIHTKGH